LVLRRLGLDRILLGFLDYREPAVTLNIGSDPVIYRVILLLSFGFHNFLHGLLAGVLGSLSRRAFRTRRHLGIDSRRRLGNDPIVMHVRGGLGGDPVSKHDGRSRRSGLVNRHTACRRLGEPPSIPFA